MGKGNLPDPSRSKAKLGMCYSLSSFLCTKLTLNTFQVEADCNRQPQKQHKPKPFPRKKKPTLNVNILIISEQARKSKVQMSKGKRKENLQEGLHISEGSFSISENYIFGLRIETY